MTKNEALTLMINLTEEIRTDMDKLLAKYLKEFEKLAEEVKEWWYNLTMKLAKIGRDFNRIFKRKEIGGLILSEKQRIELWRYFRLALNGQLIDTMDNIEWLLVKAVDYGADKGAKYDIIDTYLTEIKKKNGE